MDEPEQRRRELEQFEVVVQRFPDTVFVTDGSGYVTFVSREFTALDSYACSSRYGQ